MAETRVERVGIYSAYRFAVEGGYTGTEEEFEAGLAASANYASNAQASAESASASATSASTYASNASASASSAFESATAAATAQASAETAQESAEAAAQQAEETLDEYAKVDGYYEEMTVGNAEQLISNVYVEDSEAYKYRTSGGSADIGNREYDEIVGGTVAWNQLAYNNQTATLLMPNSRTVNISTNSKPSVINHIYCFSCNVTADTTVNGLNAQYGGIANFGQGTGVKTKIAKSTVSATYIYGYIGFDEPSGASLTYKDFNIFDLTQMFGSTIADYIYNLEQTTAGAGVAWFRKYFPESYYAYNSGELISVEGLSSHDMVGFNQWDEKWELGSFESGTGLPIASNTIIRAKNYINIIPNTVYCFTAPTNGVLYWYDANNTYISETSVASGGVVKTSPTNARYLKFRMATSYGTTYNNDICINLSWSGSRNGDYEEYVKHSYALDDSLTLRGIPKLSDGKLTFDGDIYEADGTVTRKYGIRAYQSGDESLTDAITDGTNTVYKLATPTTETAEPYQSPQIVDDYGTEEYVSTTIVPVGHNTKYMANSVDKLNHLPTLADSDGDYVIRQSDTQMSLIPLTQVKELPDAPSADGTYTLKVTVTDGEATYSWEG